MLRHAGSRMVAVGWGAFLAENLVMSENKEALVRHLGHQTYIQCYG